MHVTRGKQPSGEEERPAFVLKMTSVSFEENHPEIEGEMAFGANGQMYTQHPTKMKYFTFDWELKEFGTEKSLLRLKTKAQLALVGQEDVVREAITSAVTALVEYIASDGKRLGMRR